MRQKMGTLRTGARCKIKKVPKEVVQQGLAIIALDIRAMIAEAGCRDILGMKAVQSQKYYTYTWTSEEILKAKLIGSE